jgi:hypothetical protein
MLKGEEVLNLLKNFSAYNLQQAANEHSASAMQTKLSLRDGG